MSLVTVIGEPNCSNDRLKERSVNSSVRRQSLDQTVLIRMFGYSNDNTEHSPCGDLDPFILHMVCLECRKAICPVDQGQRLALDLTEEWE